MNTMRASKPRYVKKIEVFSYTEENGQVSINDLKFQLSPQNDGRMGDYATLSFNIVNIENLKQYEGLEIGLIAYENKYNSDELEHSFIITFNVVNGLPQRVTHISISGYAGYYISNETGGSEYITYYPEIDNVLNKWKLK